MITYLGGETLSCVVLLSGHVWKEVVELLLADGSGVEEPATVTLVTSCYPTAVCNAAPGTDNAWQTILLTTP